MLSASRTDWLEWQAGYVRGDLMRQATRGQPSLPTIGWRTFMGRSRRQASTASLIERKSKPFTSHATPRESA